ncbi:alpha-galactosidase [Spirilliplanes yamanashiensis]|uniref:Alpha-galactosidase n=1 Tax=Spirilliplanes yamanashiensis TaxID=42233 RepID=A0A8J3YB46_9ACTN|nr:alpha-galactosidase [Spirilliplanes yamanashiensis]MDP9818010.1 alpha-galactosidase [Spirilliplanes yamanashiensis]GIJ04819.1 alpha-galactosidase [Spirilliplanes yamanashiensis]
MAPTVHHLRAAGVSLVLDATGDGLPRVAHWGADLGELDRTALADLVAAAEPQVASNTMDAVVPVSVLPEQSAGWLGTPGVAGHRDGADFSTRFVVSGVDAGQPGRLVVTAADDAAALGLVVEVELTPAGLVRQRATLTNTGAGAYTVEAVTLALPVGGTAAELLDLTGRHLRERSPQRAAFRAGTWTRENRRGRTGTDATLVLVAGEAGFGFRSGEVWGLHVAFSGNHRTLAERTPGGVALLAGGELLLPGEVRLATGEAYATPWVYGSHGAGLDELSGRFHRHLRERPHHPRRPRPVTMNTWEAVYFDQRLDTLAALADAAAAVGAERFVLDDGWFRGRRDDTAGLGDWHVDETVWPDGLHPLVRHVRGLGLEFGLWVEPEMINLDSGLARAHPEWILGTGGRLPPASRHQQVLDLGHPAAFAHLLDRLDALLTEYDIGFLKWDHNRDLVEAGTAVTGGAGVHRQTLAVYALMDEVRRRHPRLEIESCSSGGGRVDLGVLERADRVWASDSIDALERQQIQRWTTLLLPPELLGAHVGSPVAHTTRRTHPLDLRAGTALFGHFGIEWDLTTASAAELARLTEWVAAYKELRALLHTGTVVRADHPDPALQVHGVVAADRSRAVYALVQLATGVHAPPGRVRLPGLDPAARYRVAPLPPGDRVDGPGMTPLRWWAEGVTLPGAALAAAGLQAPMLFPERLVLVEAARLP